MPYCARFDDLGGDVALVFGEPDEVVRADHPDEVAAALDEVDRATRGGRWAFGFVSYESGFGLPDATTPLVWFGISSAPDRSHAVRPSTRDYWVAPWTPAWTRAQHAAAVRSVRDAIAAGDVYQVNVTARLRSRIVGDERACYADLACAQHAAYSAYVDFGTGAVLSASPELFFDWTPPLLRTRPMKGTAARGTTPAEDEERRHALAASPKDIAENVMIVDLLRNDLARIAQVGTVRVPALLRAEAYPTVWQLTSDVTCEPRPGVGLRSIMAALFPSGSVTGAPKLAAMQQIARLEDEPRGIYTGAIGWVAPVNHQQRARFSVAIRTITLERASGVATYGAGGGITIGSDAAAEYDELVAKTAVLSALEYPGESLVLLETLALLGGEARHLDRHLARLASSAAVFDFVWDEARVRADLAAAIGGHADARVAVRLAADGSSEVAVTALPVPAPAPVRLAIDRPSVPPVSPWVRHKTSRRRIYTDALRRHPHADDVVLVNTRGEVTETTIANLAVRIGADWCTPPVESGCLPGVGRAVALEAGELVERALTVADLQQAEEIALLSSLRGTRPAVLVDSPRAGPSCE